MLPLIAAERGFSFTFAMGGFSAGLLMAGLLSPTVGGLIDRYGGHRVMPFGSLAGAPASSASRWRAIRSPTGRSGCCSAPRSRRRSTIRPSRRSAASSARGRAPPITVLTLAGGFASTVSWPVTYALLEPLGWKGTYLVYAAVLALVAAPLHAFALPRDARRRRSAARRGCGAGAGVAPRQRRRVRAAGRGLRILCVHPVRPVGASARDPAARRDRRRHGRHDRGAVRPLAGRRPAVRAHLCAQRPSAVDRALRRHADRVSLRDAGAARHLDADRFRVRRSCSAPPTG